MNAPKNHMLNAILFLTLALDISIEHGRGPLIRFGPCSEKQLQNGCATVPPAGNIFVTTCWCYVNPAPT